MLWRLRMKLEIFIEAVLTFGLKKCEKCGFKIMNYPNDECPLCGAKASQWTTKEIIENIISRGLLSAAVAIITIISLSILFPH